MSPGEEKWRAFFKDPQRWWDNRVGKRNPRAPDFKVITRCMGRMEGPVNQPSHEGPLGSRNVFAAHVLSAVVAGRADAVPRTELRKQQQRYQKG